MRTRLVVMALLLSSIVAAPPADAAEFAEQCAAPTDGPLTLAVGVVGCQRMVSENVGGVTAFGYWIPPACDPASGARCPVLYYLHGTGGSFLEGVGAVGSSGNAWIKSLTHGPPVNPRTAPDHTVYANTATWVDQPDLDMIVISPHGMTVPDGFGPAPGKETFWFDWNPKYAQGGAYEKYPTPAPRYGSFLQTELVAYVDAHFPTIPDRTGRAIVGYSMGGIGSYTNGFQRPDVWSSLGMRSGGGLPDLYQTYHVDVPITVAPPVPVPYQPVPGTPSHLANPTVWDALYGAVLTTGFGDPAIDNIWYRGNQPAALADNVAAWNLDTQSTHLKHFVNDAIPRSQADEVAGFETILYPTNLHLEDVFDFYGVQRTFDVGPGDHSGRNGVPYFREQLEQQYANLLHADGGGSPRPDPLSFDYRSIRNDFTIWDWHVSVQREPVEFLHLTDVTCAGLNVRGTGLVTLTEPDECGGRTVEVDLGPSQATDEHASIGNSQSYGRIVYVDLED